MIFSIFANASYSEMTGSLAGYGRPKGSIETSLSSDGSTLTIKVVGRFDFSLHEAFRRAYEAAMATVVVAASLVVHYACQPLALVSASSAP